MNKTFIVNDHLLSAGFMAAPAAARGFWLALQAYSSQRETGGVIVGARDFPPTPWRNLLGKGGSPRAVADLVRHRLATWVDSDLHLAFYDLGAETSYKASRSGGARGGLATQAKARNLAEPHAPDGLPSSPALSHGLPRVEGDRERRAEGRQVGGGPGSGSQGEVGVPSPSADRPHQIGSEVDVPHVETPSRLRSPRGVDEAIALFSDLFRDRFGQEYVVSGTDTMTWREAWNDLEHSELPERITAFLGTTDTARATIPNFIGWVRGPRRRAHAPSRNASGAA